MALKYRKSLSPQRKAMLNMKWQASVLFRGKKASYPASVPVPFSGSHLDDDIKPAVLAAFEKSQTELDTKIMYSTIVHKVLGQWSSIHAPNHLFSRLTATIMGIHETTWL